MYYHGPGKPRTQKARGILALSPVVTAAYNASIADSYAAPVETVASWDADALRARLDMHFRGGGRIIVRPCPARPRHGFIDSEVMYMQDMTHERISELARRVLAADPEGEIVFARYIECQTNFVATPTSLTLGPGHDGATAGRNAITIPVPNPYLSSPKAIAQGGYRFYPENYGIQDGEVAYIEGVAFGPTRYVTQVRAGPSTPMVENFVPQPTLVQRVIPVDTDDLLEWEERMLAVRGAEGVVVYHPGGSLTSHFGVHAVLNSIPYITTYTPLIGDTLKPEGSAPWGASEFRDLSRMLMSLLYSQPPTPSHAHHEFHSLGKFGFSTLHASGYLLQSSSHTSRVTLAHGIAAAIRVFLALGYAETRHLPERGHFQQHDEIGDCLDWDDAASFIHGSREDVFRAGYRHTVTDMAHYATWAIAAFTPEFWRGEKGFGGAKWQECAAASRDMLWAAIDFTRDPSAERFGNMMTVFNRLVTLAHNNGWWLNKIMEQHQGDLYAANPQAGMIAPVVYTYLSRDIPEPGQHVIDTFAALERSDVLIERANDAARIVQERRERESEWRRRDMEAMHANKKTVAAPSPVTLIQEPQAGAEMGQLMADHLNPHQVQVKVCKDIDMNAIYKHPSGDTLATRLFSIGSYHKLFHSMFASKQFARVDGTNKASALDVRLVCGHYPGIMVRLRNGFSPEKLNQYIPGGSAYTGVYDSSHWMLISFGTQGVIPTQYWRLVYAATVAQRWMHDWLPWTADMDGIENALKMTSATPDQAKVGYDSCNDLIQKMAIAIESGWHGYHVWPEWMDKWSPKKKLVHVEPDTDEGDDEPEEEYNPPEPAPSHDGPSLIAEETVTGIKVSGSFGGPKGEAITPTPRYDTDGISAKEAAALLTAAFKGA